MKNRKRYAPEWHAEIRPTILARDKFKCTKCRVKQRSFGYYDAKGKFIECDDFMAAYAKKEGFKPKRVWLQVVHLDQDPSNNELSNLKAMCPRCHLAYHHKFNALKKLARKGK